MTNVRSWAILAGAWLIVLSGCEATHERHAPGALPAHRGDLAPRLTAATYMAHGDLLEREGQWAQAAEQYRKAIELAPNVVAPHDRLGITLNKLGRHAEASAEFRAALAIDPRQATLHNNLGFSLYLEGQLDAAERTLTRALELQPAFRRARMNRGLVLAKLGRFDEALADFQLAGQQEDAYYNLAVLQADAGLYAEAARTLQQALAIKPDFTAAREQLRQIARLAAVQEAEQAALARAAGADSAPGPELQPPPASDEVQPAASIERAATPGDEEAEPVEQERPTEGAGAVTADAERVSLRQQVDALIRAAAELNYREMIRTGELIQAFDDWIEAWLLDAPWYECSSYRVEELAQPAKAER